MKQTLLFLFLISLLMPPQVAMAESGECRQRVNYEIGRELRLYRNVLFGKPRAEDAPIGEVRYDTEGRAWLKTDNENAPWINSVNTGHAKGWEWENDDMNEQDEHAESLPLVGIFETKRMTTSELIPYLLQSIRALECRAMSYCNIARASESFDKDDEAQDIGSVQLLGCIEFTDLESFPECHLGGETPLLLDQADGRGYCNEMVTQTIQRERELLKLVVEYDAGFRSLLQFAGNFDIFLKEMRWPLANTVRQAVELIGSLQRIPCFVSSCDSSPAVKDE